MSTDSTHAPANPFAPPKAAVADVPQSARPPLASRGLRFLAMILDGIIANIFVYVPLAVVLALTAGAAAAATAFTTPTQFWLTLITSWSAALLAGFAGFAVWAVITIALVSRNGQTIAKRLFGMKVVRSDGSKASLGRIFWLRNVVNTIIMLIPLIGFLYFLVDALMIFGEQRQCVHDKIADTIVVQA